jgi:hypothetical protein
MTYKEWIWGLDGTTIVDKLLNKELLNNKEVQGEKGK